MLLILLLSLTAATTTTAAQEEEEVLVSEPPNDTKLVDSDEIVFNIQTQLYNVRLQDYRLYENGTAQYTFQLLTVGGKPLENKTMTIITEHTFTPQFGYIYNQTGVYTPDGSQKLVISTFRED